MNTQEKIALLVMMGKSATYAMDMRVGATFDNAMRPFQADEDDPVDRPGEEEIEQAYRVALQKASALGEKVEQPSWEELVNLAQAVLGSYDPELVVRAISAARYTESCQALLNDLVGGKL
jgi:hypothetical protein